MKKRTDYDSRYDYVNQESRKIQKKAEELEQYGRATGADSVQSQSMINSLYIDSIHAKMALLDEVNL